jgi:undecaprenyl diphosphate synthase
MSDNTVTLPTHLGIIMDGNRRWAKQQGLPTLKGHRQGLDTFKEISLAAFDRGIKYVSAYVFSTENWQRTEEEVSYLMGLVNKGIAKQLDSFHNAGIKLVMLGARTGVDDKILETIDDATAKTKDNIKGTLALCFNYGGQDEIADAAQSLMDQGETTITPQKLSQAMYEPDVPPIDFIIRTSGEQRLSGFMLWRAAYSELYFTDTMWPAFTVGDLDTALQEYARRQRRFGS